MSQLKVNSIVPSGGLPAGASGGGIVQTVNVLKTSQFQTTSTSYTAITGLSASIVPRSTSNKILVTYELNVSGYAQGWIRLYVNGSVSSFIGDTSAYGSQERCTHSFQGDAELRYGQVTFSGSYLHSPGSTSTQTYAFYLKTQGYNIGVGVDYDSTSNSSEIGLYPAGTITLYEVSL